MRADRLLSILLLLQARGRMTAQTLAHELEVSVRTVYRDLDALSTAGVPVYTERGPGGGCELLDSYRTTLTGLTGKEVRALFTLGIPAPLAELGIDHELRGALLKLSASLPAGPAHEQQARQRIHLDPAPWFAEREPVPHLPTIKKAVWEDRRLNLTYRLPFETQVERLVDPYSLVAKATAWYLVCSQDEQIRVHQVSKVAAAELTGEHFERPADFDLERFWQTWCATLERNRPRFSAIVRVSPSLVPYLPYYADATRMAIEELEPADQEGRVTLILHFETLEEARERILGFGGAAEILEPKALRRSVLDFATEITSLYAQSRRREQRRQDSL